jgi:hypothetical protein
MPSNVIAFKFAALLLVNPRDSTTRGGAVACADPVFTEYASPFEVLTLTSRRHPAGFLPSHKRSVS